MTFNLNKFNALRDYISYRLETNDPAVINFTLMHCDFMAYAYFGESITGATYIRGKEYPIIKGAA